MGEIEFRGDFKSAPVITDCLRGPRRCVHEAKEALGKEGDIADAGAVGDLKDLDPCGDWLIGAATGDILVELVDIGEALGGEDGIVLLTSSKMVSIVTFRPFPDGLEAIV